MRKINIVVPLCCLLVFFAFACSAKERPDIFAEPLNVPGTDNFYRVSDELYRSAQPDAEAMRIYERLGIRTVINLRAHHDDADEARGTGLKLVHIPINTWRVGADGYIIAILQAIRDAEKPVLIHCMHGADRTGLAVAMFRIVEQDWPKELALEELTEGGFGFHSIWGSIPRYLKQADIAYLRNALRKPLTPTY